MKCVFIFYVNFVLLTNSIYDCNVGPDKLLRVKVHIRVYSLDSPSGL